MYAKRIGKTQISCPSAPYLIESGRIYTNPTEQQLRAAGYKPLVERTAMPTTPFSVYYDEDDTCIYICYREEADI